MEEKILNTRKNGMAMLLLTLLGYVASIALFIYSITLLNADRMLLGVPLLILSIAYWIAGIFLFCGLKVLKPQEALVLTLFGDYIGTLKGQGFYWVNPFCTAVNPAAGTRLSQSGDVNSKENSVAALFGNNGQNAQMSVESMSKKISLKMMTLNNSRQKINDCLGNPVEIGIAVIWRVTDTAKAVFNVDNYKEYLSLQCDSALRNVVRVYPYDVSPNVDTTGDGVADEGSLRGSSEVVAARIRDEIQKNVSEAGIEVVEARITYLAYAPEIAAVMLQRQQASAIIDARKMIVDGAVGMVEMALDRLNENKVVELDDERKAAMVSNLLVVLCGNCIYISFRKKRIDQLSVSKADQIFQFGNSLIRPVQKDAFRFGCRLDGKILSLQITQFIDITTRIYSNHLAACYVWSCPAVIIKTPFHGKAAHDTVNFSALHQFFFLLPVNLDNIHLISHSFESFRGQFYIDSCRDSIFIQIIIWWIVVAAERDDRLFGFFFTATVIFASCQSSC